MGSLLHSYTLQHIYLRTICSVHKKRSASITLLSYHRRYQWSIGLTSNDVPTGVFHKELERVWHDAGQNIFFIFSTKPGMWYHFRLTIVYHFSLYII